MRMPFQPLASQMKLGAAAHATSRTFFAANRQVRVAAAPAGRVEGVPTSFVAMIATVASERWARASRARCADVSTSSGFCSVPVPATMNPRGTVIAKSMSPYSR